MTNASSCLIPLTPHKYGYKLVISVVVTVGIVSNILVILSILRQKRLLKNNFYFLVFHVSISDLSCLLLFTYNVYLIWSSERLSFISCTTCHFFRELLVIFGAYFMLVISIIRYRAVLHPLKPAISFRLLKIIACFVYVSAFLATSVMHYMSLKASKPSWSYEIIIRCGRMIVWYFLPVIVMTVIYWKMCQELKRQNIALKYTRSYSRKVSTSNRYRLLHHRNRKTFGICSAVVVSYAVSGLLRHVASILDIVMSENGVML